MIVAAWEHLRQNGEMTHHEPLHELNVKRSAFVRVAGAVPRRRRPFDSADSSRADFALNCVHAHHDSRP
jgi:hypothetical protein